MVSTLASGDVGAFVGVSDIAMMYSVTDIAGLNRISRAVLANAANAIAGMARSALPEAAGKPAIGLTMFGVTTACVTQAVAALKDDYDCLVFHATGTGGRAMEKLVDSGMLAGVIDATTTEIADLIGGGVMSAGDDRLGAVARTGIPYVGSVGALDMVNFWAPETVPEKYRERKLHRHNPQVTLMRTTADENRADRQVDRRAAEPLHGTGAVPDPGKGRLGDGRAGAAVPRPGGRRGAVRCAGGNIAAERQAAAHPPAASHQRPGVLGGAG